MIRAIDVVRRHDGESVLCIDLLLLARTHFHQGNLPALLDHIRCYELDSAQLVRDLVGKRHTRHYVLEMVAASSKPIAGSDVDLLEVRSHGRLNMRCCQIAWMGHSHRKEGLIG